MGQHVAVSSGRSGLFIQDIFNDPLDLFKTSSRYLGAQKCAHFFQMETVCALLGSKIP